jgi:hypothetical protein
LNELLYSSVGLGSDRRYVAILTTLGISLVEVQAIAQIIYAILARTTNDPLCNGLPLFTKKYYSLLVVCTYLP